MRVDAFRGTHDVATVNSNQDVARMKLQLKRLTDETNRLTEMMTHFISTVDPVQSVGVSQSKKLVRHDVCGEDGHSAEVCQQRRNHLN